MVFVRVKKIGKHKYGYLVENSWKSRKKGSRQKVKKYLGKIHEVEPKKEVDFAGFLDIDDFNAYLSKNNADTVIKDLIAWELFKHGISNDIKYDPKRMVVVKDNKDIVLKLNDGFMFNDSLLHLLTFKNQNFGEETSYMLARAFVDAGIKVPKEVFVGVFEKFTKGKNID